MKQLVPLWDYLQSFFKVCCRNKQSSAASGRSPSGTASCFLEWPVRCLHTSHQESLKPSAVFQHLLQRETTSEAGGSTQLIMINLTVFPLEGPSPLFKLFPARGPDLVFCQLTCLEHAVFQS